MTEIDQEVNLEAGGFQVIMQLRSVLVGQLGNGLDFQNDLIEQDEVRNVTLLQGPPLVA